MKCPTCGGVLPLFFLGSSVCVRCGTRLSYPFYCADDVPEGSA